MNGRLIVFLVLMAFYIAAVFDVTYLSEKLKQKPSPCITAPQHLRATVAGTEG